MAVGCGIEGLAEFEHATAAWCYCVLGEDKIAAQAWGCITSSQIGT